MTQLRTLFELPIFIAGHYLGLSILFAAAWSVGRTLTRRLVYRSELEAAVVSTALGLGVWSTTLFLLAVVGLFRPVPILLLLVGSQYACRRCWVGAWGAAKSWLAGRRSVAWTFAAALVALLLAPLFTLPLYPPTEFDATMFHLPLASETVDHGRIGFFDNLRYPVFPALQEVLYAAAMLFHDDIAASMVHFGCFLLVGVLLYCWGSWVSSRRAGLWAALLWLGVDAAVKAAIGAYVDCALTLYVGVALFAFHRYARRGDRGWLAVAAALVGFAAATKYHGLFFVCVLSVGVVIFTLLRRRWKHLAWYGVVLAGAMLPWYGFIYYHTGNPLFPFFPAIFGVSPWAYELRYSGEMPASSVDIGPIAFLEKIGMLFRVLYNKMSLLLDRSLIRTLRLPVDVFRDTDSFKGESLSPLFLFTLPLIVLTMFRLRHVRYLALLTGFYLVAWAATAQDLRYLLPALPLIALVGAESIDRLFSKLTSARRPWMAWALTIAISLPLVLQISQVSSAVGWSLGKPPTTQAQRERFLELRLRSYEAIRTLNEQHGSDYSVYALFCENMKHYVEGTHLGDWFGPERYGRVIGKLHNRDALHRELSQMGVQYLLVPDLSNWKKRLGAQFVVPTLERLEPAFEITYEDRFTRVYKVLSPDDGSRPTTVGEPDDPGRSGTASD